MGTPTPQNAQTKRDRRAARYQASELTRSRRPERSHSASFDHRRRPETLRTAMAIAFFCPTNTTNRLPLVTPV
jgi:hypothetical protein